MAQLKLGGCYAAGEGAAKDFVEAAKWFRKAAEQGYAPAHYELGVMFYSGQVVLKNGLAAYKWLTLAAIHGGKESKQAQKRRDLLKKSMTADRRRPAAHPRVQAEGRMVGGYASQVAKLKAQRDAGMVYCRSQI